MVGEASFCIDDLAGVHSAPDEVARQEVPDYREVISGSMLIEDIV